MTFAAFSTPAQAEPAWMCGGNWFCAYDGFDGQDQILDAYGACGAIINIGNMGKGDRISSIWNKLPNRRVNLLNWTGSAWETIWSTVPGDVPHNLGPHANNRADAVEFVC
ncbi:hypothetical protein ACFYZ5_45515 [Streptomyces chartreusis]|uniref:hypothetical protein n=1 Tax=Streptomyces chartreusis TaxID=1969 RepID=UPI003677E469